MPVYNAADSLQKYRNIQAEYDALFAPLIQQVRTKYAKRGGREADLKESLEAHLRAYVVNAWLNALNWRMDATPQTGLPNMVPEAPVHSSERQRTRYLDYLGFERGNCERPLLIVETKRHSSPRPELKASDPPASTYAEVVARGLRGEELRGEWTAWLRDLGDYVRSVHAQLGVTPTRAVITNGKWIIVFIGPADAFLDGGAKSQDQIFVCESEEVVRERYTDLYRLLDHSAVAGASRPIKLAEVLFFLDPACYRAGLMMAIKAG
jgi:hypothetical protein